MALAAELAEEAVRQELDLATTPVLHMEAHLVLDALVQIVLKNPQTQEPVTPMHAQSMEVGGPGAPIPPAAELVEEAHREELDLATTPVLHTEAHLVLDA